MGDKYSAVISGGTYKYKKLDKNTSPGTKITASCYHVV
jgi:hypothetical protein